MNKAETSILVLGILAVTVAIDVLNQIQIILK